MDHQTFAQLLGNYGEFVGAFAVVLTLAYLARQIKQSNNVSAAQAYQERANTRMSLHNDQSDSEYLAPILFRLSELGWPSNVEAIEDLEGLDLHRFRQNQLAGLVRFDNNFYQYRHGFLDDHAWELTKFGIRVNAPSWKRLGILESGATAPFREEVERLIAR